MFEEPAGKTTMTEERIGEPIKVTIIEDERDIRDGLGMLINYTDGFTCVGKYGSMEEALAGIRHRTPDVILSDIGLPGMNGIEGVRLIREQFPEMTILMLSVYQDDDRIFHALCAGAVGYLLKKTPPTKILDALREAVAGGAPMSPEVARKVITIFRDFRPPEEVEYDLTPHEVRILKLLVEGHSYKTAAARLNVTPSTISFHLKNIYEKLQVHSKSEAVAKALQYRLIK